MKMRNVIFCVSFALMTSLYSPAKANFVGGNQLHQWCQNNGRVEQSLCMGFIVGVADAIQAAQYNGYRGPTVCFPDASNVGQVVDVGKKWLVDHPHLRHIVASDLVRDALEQAFPCK